MTSSPPAKITQDKGSSSSLGKFVRVRIGESIFYGKCAHVNVLKAYFGTYCLYNMFTTIFD